MRSEKKQLDMLDIIFEHTQEAMYAFSEFGRIIDFNKTAVSEVMYSEEELKNMSITEIYTALEVNSDGKVIIDSTKANISQDMMVYRKNQTCFPAKVKLISYQYGDVKYGVILSDNDSDRADAIRAHKNVLESLEEATKMKNEFLANVTHELRTPINGMKGMIESLLESELTNAQAETASILAKCCNNMTKIINDLLDFSKLEAGKLSVEYREFNFKKFLDEILAFNVGRINEKGLKLIVDVGNQIPPFVVGDELRLGQVINNLFSNAIKFTNEGHIGLEVATTVFNSTQVELLFMIIDTGIGISSEDLDKLFKSFSQVDGSITRRFGGTGLGLAICKQLVELMGGKIHVDSEKGKGSTFSFTVRFGVGRGAMQGEVENYPVGKFVFDKGNNSSAKGNQAGATNQDNNSNSRSNSSSNSGLDNSNTNNSYSFVPIDVFELENNFENKKQQLLEVIEKLAICMELESWEKAEEFANEIRNAIPKEEAELKKFAFQTLLAVRKEDYQKASSSVDELEKLLLN